MGGKAMNPADAHRKEIRKKEIKRNKLERQKGRETGVLRKDPEKIKEEIYKLETMKADGPLDIQRKHKLRQKKDELEFVLKKRKERGEETPEKRETRVIYKDWILPTSEIGAPRPRPPPPPPPPLPVSGESRYVDDMAVISSLPVPPPPPLPPNPSNILYSTFQPQPRPPRTGEGKQDVYAMIPPPPPPPPPPPTKAPAMTMPCLVPNVSPPGVSFVSPPPPPPPTKAPAMTMPCLVPKVSPPGVSFFPPPPPPPPPPTHAPQMTMRNILPSVPPREVSFVPRPSPPQPTVMRPPSTLKPSHIRSAAPTVVRRPLAQNNPELTSMIPASVRVRRETTSQKPRAKPLLPTLTRCSNPFGIKQKPATKACSIDESYTAFLQDMKALGAL